MPSKPEQLTEANGFRLLTYIRNRHANGQECTHAHLSNEVGGRLGSARAFETALQFLLGHQLVARGPDVPAGPRRMVATYIPTEAAATWTPPPSALRAAPPPKRSPDFHVPAMGKSR